MNNAAGECVGEADAGEDEVENSRIVSSRGAAESFSDVLVPNKYFRLFRDVVQAGIGGDGGEEKEKKGDKKKGKKKKGKDEPDVAAPTGDSGQVASMRLSVSDKVWA